MLYHCQRSAGSTYEVCRGYRLAAAYGRVLGIRPPCLLATWRSHFQGKLGALREQTEGADQRAWASCRSFSHSGYRTHTPGAGLEEL